MKDFISNNTGNSRFLKSVSNFLELYPDYATFAAALVSGTLPIDLNGVNPNGYSQLGTALNKANLMTDATATALGLSGADPTVNEALALLSERARIEIVSYTGTGLYGSSNPCSITFSKPVDIILWVGYELRISLTGYNQQHTADSIVMSAEDTSYQSGHGFAYAFNPQNDTYPYTLFTRNGKKSADGKTYSWYNTRGYIEQLNYQNQKYYFIGIGEVQS